MIKVTKPNFKKTFSFLDRLNRFDPKPILEQYGRLGVGALSAATPVDTGETAGKWSYKIKGNKERYKLIWTNSEVPGSAPLVLMLQYGHATKSGYFLSGRDFINPALGPIYDSLNKRLLEEAVR
jgi:hypothetical protein